MMKLLPWVLVLLFAVLAGFLWVSRSPGGAGKADRAVPPVEERVVVEEQLPAEAPRKSEGQVLPDAVSAPGERDSDCLETLRQCRLSLEENRGLLERCRREPDRASGPRPETRPSLEKCMAHPAVRKLADDVRRLEAWDSRVTDCLRRERKKQARHATLNTLLEEDLELSRNETAWLAEAACALKELRWMALARMHDDAFASSEVWENVRRERQEMLRDIESYLGVDEYARFRKIGGIGLLNDTLDCQDDAIR